MYLGFLEIFLQDIKIHIQVALLSRKFLTKVNIVSDVDIDSVVVDRILDSPVVGCSFVAFVSLDETAIGYVHQAIRHSHPDHQTVHFICWMIFGWPPDTGTDSLIGGSDVIFSIRILGPRNSSIPGRTNRHQRFSFVSDDDLLRFSRNLLLLERYEMRRALFFHL